MAATALLCDGSAFARDLFGGALEGAGWTVVARVGTGAAALEALRTHRPAVVVTDLLVPDLEGFALLAALRAAAPATVIVVCTALGDAAVRDACAAAGAALVLPKPLAPARLVEALRVHAA